MVEGEGGFFFFFPCFRPSPRYLQMSTLAALCVRSIGETTQAYELLGFLSGVLPLDMYQDLLMQWSWKALMINHKFVGKWLLPYWRRPVVKKKISLSLLSCGPALEWDLNLLEPGMDTFMSDVRSQIDIIRLSLMDSSA